MYNISSLNLEESLKYLVTSKEELEILGKEDPMQLIYGNAYQTYTEINRHTKALLDKQMDNYLASAVPSPVRVWNKTQACHNLKIHLALLDYEAKKRQLSELLDEQLEDYFASVIPPEPSKSEPVWNKKVACNKFKELLAVSQSFPFGTKVRWYLDDENRSTCVQKSYGLLEVFAKREGKLVTMAPCQCNQRDRGIHSSYCHREGLNVRIYRDYTSWMATLPKTGGISTVFPVRHSLSPFERRLSMPLPVEEDVRLVQLLQLRFMSHPRIWNDPSIGSQIRILNEYVKFYQTDSRNEAKLKSLVRKREKLIRMSKNYSREQLEERSIKFKNTGVYRLYVKVGGIPYEIGYYYYMNLIVGADYQTFKTFNEMGADMVNGKPQFVVSYKGTFHELNCYKS